MRPLSLTAALAATLLALPAAAQDTPFEPTGELRFHGYGSIGTSASFDADRLVGPSVNLTRREDGTWGGDLDGHSMSLEVTPTRISGPNVSLAVSTRDGRIGVEGLFFNQRFRVEVDGKRLHGRFGECSFDLSRKRSGTPYQGQVGCFRRGGALPSSTRATMTLIGQADEASPPMPQLALALLAVLPS